MASVNAIRDANHIPVALGVQSTDSTATYPFTINPITGRLLVDMAGGGSGTVTSISIVSANGFAGSSDGDPATPALTISTTVNAPVLAGNGTAIAAATTTGSGSTVVLATSPTLVTPVLGVATASSINGLTITTSTGTLTIANGKVVTVSNTLTFTGTDSSSVAFGAGGTVLYTTSAIPLTVGTTTIASGNDTRVLFNNAGVLGQYVISGSGNVAMTTSPVFTTPNIGAATATSVNGMTITSSTGTFTLTNGKTFAVTHSLTLSGTDSTVMTFPTTSKTIAANDGSNWTIASQAVGDLAYASSTTAYTRLAAVAIGQVLISAGTGTAPAWSASPSITTIEIGSGGATDTTLSRAGAGDLAVEGVSVLTTSNAKTITGKTLGDTLILAENASIGLDPAGSADGKFTGITITAIAGYTQAFGDLVYLDPTDSRWELCDANSAAAADGDSRGIIGMVVVAGTDGNACTILLNGVIRADAKFPAFTINNPIYVSETAGAVTQTQPTTTDVVIRIVGAALTADEMYFSPDNTWVTHT